MSNCNLHSWKSSNSNSVCPACHKNMDDVGELRSELELRDKMDPSISKSALESLYSELDDLRAKLDNLTTASKAAFHEMICTCNGELDCAKCKLFQLLENRND